MRRIWPVLAVLSACAAHRSGGSSASDAPSPAASSAPEQPVAYTDMSSAEALRNLRRIEARDPAQLPEADLVEWVRARFAWVALLRLQGKEHEALEVFGGCGSWCAKHGPAGEWVALKRWGCRKDPRAGPCR